MTSNNRNNTQYGELSRKADIIRFYDPPGEISKYGRRHDNDFKEISKISVIPSRDEMLCDRQPFLPSTLPDTPHFLPDGAARLLDTQFRLLREDMLNPIRGGLTNFLTELSKNWSKEFLKKIQEEGRYTYDNGPNDNGDLQIYTYAQFVNISCDRRKGFAFTIRFIPPKIHNAKDEIDRREYWQKSKRLLTGNLVILLLPSRRAQLNNFIDSDDLSFHFGIITSRDEVALAKYDGYSEIDISFTDPSIYPIALNEISNFDKITKDSLEKRFIVESTSIYLEAYYHILKTLQTANPSSLPFEEYLAPNLNNFIHKNSVNVKVEIPLYTKTPGFEFDLSVLCKQRLKLNVVETNTYNEVAKNITRYSKLDETQAKALVSALTREIALIEGPPGTGKTVVGIEVMKVLLAQKDKKIGPILTICFTNHALDQFLEHLLDENITNIVRLGSRTKSDRIRQFSLEEVCKKNAHYGSSIKMSHMTLEQIEKEANEIKGTLLNRWISWDDIREYLMIEERRFYNKFIYDNNLPSWVLEANDAEDVEESQDKFHTVQNKRNKNLSIFEKWLHGEDIRIIKKRKTILLEQEEKEKRNKKMDNKKKNKKWISFSEFEALNEKSELNSDESQIDHKTIQWIKSYNEPKTNRLLDVLLLNEYSIWEMSREERHRLHDYWRAKINEKFVNKLLGLKKEHEEERNIMNEIYDEGNRQVLLNIDVIGMTTNGAAKFQSLIRSVGPKIIICEEAGEVLEAHILSALTPSTQHLILIGDHNQLRPHIATHSLSIDSPTGKNYQLDKSLFERLVYGDKAVKIEKTQLLTQRRMRKIEISDLIRRTLYPKLIDGENTAKYENVRGAQHNVYFIDHKHPEDGSGGDLTTRSHVNRYEVKMVVEMVKYFVRNGYTEPEDIAVLTPYLGQMIKIRDALAKSFVVVIDERDAQEIAEMESNDNTKGKDNKGKNNKGKDNTKGKNNTKVKDMKGKDDIDDNPSTILKTPLNQPITLRTVDNFQGEEANIVIISLVRNFSKSGKHDSIGFLKSPNRSNVLLSRARKGMYLIGNSELMAMKSKKMWAPVIDILRNRDPSQVGLGMPIVCNQHSDYENIIVEPEKFAQISPDGGCYRPCPMLLPCKHTCIYKCHSDNPDHIGINCSEPCTKSHPECNHPCIKLCFEDCGQCDFPIGNIVLPCDHTLQDAKCWQNQIKDTLECMELITRKLPYCKHSLEIHCFESIYNVKCKEKCRKILECGHECLNECFECQSNSASREFGTIEQTQHGLCKYVCNRCKRFCHECIHTGYRLILNKEVGRKSEKKYI